MKKNPATLALIVFSIAMSAGVSALDGYEVKGVVVDRVGPVIGASVIEQGTANGNLVQNPGY